MAMNVNPASFRLSEANFAEKKAEDLKREKDLEKATQGFEALFLDTLMKTMRETLPGNGLFPSSNATDIYQSLHDQYLTDGLSKGKQALGLKELLFEQLKDRI